jgi:hypothetical protein
MYMSWVEAVNYLVVKGMKPVSESVFSDQKRVYFAFGKNDVFVDHSATISQVSQNEFCVADYSSKRK